jgi:hypothetical protein
MTVFTSFTQRPETFVIMSMIAETLVWTETSVCPGAPRFPRSCRRPGIVSVMWWYDGRVSAVPVPAVRGMPEGPAGASECRKWCMLSIVAGRVPA